MRLASMAIWFACAALAMAQMPPDIGHEIVSDLQAGKYSEARILLDRALKQSPRDARLLTLNGLALVQSGERTEALRSFNRALESSPNYVPALEGAAQIEYETGSPRAAALLKRLVKIRPGDQTSHALLAAIAFKHGDCETVRIEFPLGHPGASSEAAALHEYGSCLVQRKRPQEAVPVFQRICELKPHDPAAIYDLAAVQFLAARFNDVIATLNPRPLKDAEALDLLAEAYEATSDGERAQAALRQAIAQQPGIAQYYTDLAYACLAQGQFQKGLAVVNAGLQRIPKTADLYVARGILFSELAQYDRGFKDFNTAQRLDPRVTLGAAAKGLAELQRSDLPEAENTARERLRKEPQDAFAHYLLAAVLSREGAAPGSTEFDQALKAASMAVELKPSFALARDLLGRLYLEQGKIDQAIEQSRLAFRANPNDEAALYHLILALRRGNRTDEVPALMKELVLLRRKTRGQLIEQHYTGQK